MAAFKFSHRLEVQFRDCDPLGHVNNAVYFTYFEEARFAYWRHVLPPDRTVEGSRSPRKYRFILAHIRCDFRAPATVGDVLDVKIRIAKIGQSSFRFAYDVVRVSDERLIAQAESVQVMYDYEAEKSVSISPDFRTKIEEFEGLTDD